jgi:membrane protease YdiL (CAAX protease family)
MNLEATSSSQHSGIKSLKPMTLLESILLFGVPAIVLALSLWVLLPALMNAGMGRPAAYTLSLSLVNAGLLLAALVGYRLEGNPRNWTEFAGRMRLTRMSGRTWLWMVGGTLLFGGLALLVNSLAVIVYKTIGFTQPEMLPGKLTLWMQVVILFFNIGGEELWWRGYILPRQELTHGKWAWLIHGLLWACFHMFKWWAVPFMMITCLIIPFVAQRTRNTWPGLVNHLVVNGASVIMSAF